MKLTNLTPAFDTEFENWLDKKLKLTSYQKSVLREEEILRFSRYKIYKRIDKQQVSPLWRLTLVFYPLYMLLLLISLPLTYLVTGKWGFGDKFYDNFHAKWVRKLKF